MARVAGSTTIPVATGERLVSKYEFADVLGKQAAAILQPALGRVGGILEGKKIAGMAEAHYAQMAPHLYAGPIEAAANIQLGTCIPQLPDSGEHRDLRRFLQRYPESAHPVAGRLHHPTDRAGHRDRIERGRRRRQPLYGEHIVPADGGPAGRPRNQRRVGQRCGLKPSRWR